MVLDKGYQGFVSRHGTWLNWYMRRRSVSNEGDGPRSTLCSVFISNVYNGKDKVCIGAAFMMQIFVLATRYLSEVCDRSGCSM
jgi:hypothetical protein